MLYRGLAQGIGDIGTCLGRYLSGAAFFRECHQILFRLSFQNKRGRKKFITYKHKNIIIFYRLLKCFLIH